MSKVHGRVTGPGVLYLLCIAAGLLLPKVSASDEPTVGFVTWTDLQPYQTDVDNYTLLEIVSQADDTPQQQITLPFLFPFYGSAQQHVWVNPNGALFFTPVPPCGQYFGTFPSGECSLDNSYKNGILGYGADMRPSASANASVSVGHSDDGCVIVLYDSVPHFSTNNRPETFRITLCEDGHIALSWDEVVGEAVTGVRGTDSTPFAVFTVEQQASNQAWETPITGLYPNPDDMRNGSTFHVCPVTQEWCLTPSTITTGNTTHTVHLSTFSISCTNLVDYRCRIQNGTLSEPMIVMANSLNSTTISCTIPAELLTTQANFSISPVAIQDGAADLVAEHLVLQIVNVDTGGICDAQPIHEPACDSCALCEQEYGCLDLQCAANSTDVFQRRGCNGHCGNEFYADIHGDCCELSEIDCLGNCGGEAIQALQKDIIPDTYICCLARNVDCQGYCNGGAEIDACGTCAGGMTGVEPDNTGEGCLPDLLITPSELAVVADAAHPTIWNITTVEVHNYNPISVKLRTFVTPANENAPTISLKVIPNSNVLPPNSTIIVQVNISMASLFTQETYTWELKEVSIGYTVEQGTAFVDVHIPVYVSTTGCQHVTTQNTCAAAPGCVACLTYDTPRSLRAIDMIEGNDDFVLAQPPQPPQRRRAFNQMLPDNLRPATNHIDSYCRDGTTAAACYIQSATHRTASLVLLSFAVFAILLICP